MRTNFQIAYITNGITANIPYIVIIQIVIGNSTQIASITGFVSSSILEKAVKKPTKEPVGTRAQPIQIKNN